MTSLPILQHITLTLLAITSAYMFLALILYKITFRETGEIFTALITNTGRGLAIDNFVEHEKMMKNMRDILNKP